MTQRKVEQLKRKGRDFLGFFCFPDGTQRRKAKIIEYLFRKGHLYTSNLKRCMVYVGPHTKAQAKKVSTEKNILFIFQCFFRLTKPKYHL
jgi:hypothetical protein